MIRYLFVNQNNKKPIYLKEGVINIDGTVHLVHGQPAAKMNQGAIKKIQT